MNNRTGMTLVALAIVLAATAAVLAHRLQTHRDDIGALRTEIADLGKRVEAARVARASASLPVPVPAPAIQTAEVVSSAEVAAPAALPAASGDTQAAMQAMDRRRDMLKDPEYRNARLEREKLMLHRQYADMPAWVGIDAAMLDRVVHLMADAYLESQEVSASQVTLQTADRTLGLQELQRTAEDQQRLRQERDRRLAELLGPEGQKLFLEYEQNRSGRMQLATLNQQLGSEHALTEENVRSLSAVMVKGRTSAIEQMTQEMKDLAAQNPGGVKDPALGNAIMQRSQARQREAIETSLQEARRQLTDVQYKALEEMLMRPIREREARQ